MPRTVPRKKPPPSYDTETLRQAVASVTHNQMTYREASDFYGVSKTTIFNRIKGRKTPIDKIGAGRPTVLSSEDEAALVECLIARQQWGYPCTKTELQNIVQQYITDRNLKTPFTNGRPGDEWFRLFMLRHKELSHKLPEPIQRARVSQSDPFIVYPWYRKVQQVLEENDLTNHPELIANADETGFCTDPKKVKAIGVKGQAMYRQIGGSGRQQVSVLATVTASGYKFPPFIIYKAEGAVQSRWTSPDAYPNTLYGTSTNGWMEEPLFYNWFSSMFIPHFNKFRDAQQLQNKYVLLFMDGHNSHVSFRILEAAVKNKIILIRFPSHLTHRLQPLDVAVFKGLKSEWERILVEHGKNMLAGGELHNLKKAEFSKLLGRAWVTGIKEQSIVNGFIKCGLFPLNESKFPESDFDQTKLQQYRASIQHQQPSTPEPSNSVAGVSTADLVVPQQESLPPAHTSTPVQSRPESPSLLEVDDPPQISTAVPNLPDTPSFLDPDDPPLPPDRRPLSPNPTPTSDHGRSIMDVFMKSMRSEATSSKSVEKQIRMKKTDYGEVLTSPEIIERERILQLKRDENSKKRKLKKSNVKPKPRILNVATQPHEPSASHETGSSQIAGPSSKTIPLQKPRKVANKTKRLKKATSDTSDSESEKSVQYADSTSSPSATDWEDDSAQTIATALPREETDLNLKQSDFVLVKFPVKNRPPVHYVGQIIQPVVSQNENIYVRFARYEGGTVFFWPTQEDESFVVKDDIIKVLPQPITTRRMKLSFPNCKFDVITNLH